jgi:hypothetical protein
MNLVILYPSLENSITGIATVYNMAFPVVEFSREGYKIKQVFG